MAAKDYTFGAGCFDIYLTKKTKPRKDGLHIIPYAQPYLDFTKRQQIPQWQKDMAHWCNKHQIFSLSEFKDFEPRKGFKCAEYFK